MLAALVVLAGSSAALVMPRSRSHVVCRMPSLSPLPPALAASDGSHTFTYDSVQRRLPLIIESVIESNAYDAATVGALRGLAGEIAAGAPLKPLVAASDEWTAALTPCLAAGDTWFSAPWFLVENYLYKRMLELTDGPSGGADPFAAQKRASLEGSASAFQGMLAAGLAEGEVQMERLVATALWGNLADLSLSAGAALVSPADASAGASTEAPSQMSNPDPNPSPCPSSGLKLITLTLTLTLSLSLPLSPTLTRPPPRCSRTTPPRCAPPSPPPRTKR